MFDLDKLSYRAYGNLVLCVLLGLALLLNLFPFSLIELIMCVILIPLYLIVRTKFDEPIHARGLNICFVLTICFYLLLFISLKSMAYLMGIEVAFMFASILTILGCYATSTVPNKMDDKGKLFFGYKKHNESKYQKLIDFIKFNGLDTRLIDAEERLQKLDAQLYILYKRKFREDKTFKEITEEFEMDNPRVVESLDRAYFYMIGVLGI